MTVIAALDDPLPVLLAYDLPDVVRPDHDGADRRATGVGTVMRPGAREVVLGSRIRTDLASHIPAAPCSGTAAMRIPRSIVMPIVSVMGVGLRCRSERKK
jgi:hypothetical protein